MEMPALIYIPRTVEQKIERGLETFNALVIDGPKWCGKTTTAKRFAKSTLMVSDPTNDFENKARAQLDPKRAISGKSPRLLDEWQEVPKLWDAVRFASDEAGQKGMFILTGSATPHEESCPMHTGVGRFGRVKMGTMTLQELGLSSCDLSLSSLAQHAREKDSEKIYLGNLDAERIAELLVRGGWPGAIDLSLAQAGATAKNYIDAICEIDISYIDNVRRDPEKVRSVVRSLARNESSYATLNTIAKDVGVSITRQTVAEYLSLLSRLHICEDIPTWDPALRSPVKMRAAKKRHLADPSLAAAALGAGVPVLLEDFKTLGFLFESLVLHDLRVYADCCDARLYQYHDASGLEVDAVIEMESGGWIPVEIKLGAVQIEQACQTLEKFTRKIVSAGNVPPLAKLVVYGFGVPSFFPEDDFVVAAVDTLC